MKRIICFFLALLMFLPTCHAAEKELPVRGVWVGTVSNLDFPSATGLSEQSLKTEIDNIIKNCKLNNINTVFFQVRPNSDALYKSEYFPWSVVLSGTQGIPPDNEFDPLSYIIGKAHENDIELHAWINPYRIGDISKASADNPALLNPEYTVTCSDGNTYYNPALSQVRKLVLDGVREIIENYDVDGIHFDDYFYPYDVPDFPDSKEFEKYGSEFKNIDDFRRNNVNLLVKEVSELVHKKDKSLKFGISPFGIWANKRDNPNGSDTSGMSSYSEIYADSRYWVKQNLVDYICPQIYWSIENKTASFSVLLDWWNDLCKKSKTDLYIGIALYKEGTGEVGFEHPDQIQRQISLCKTKSAVKGTVLFRYGSLVDPKKQKTEYVPTPAITSSSVKITSPANGYKTESGYCSVTGVADPAKPLTLDGKNIKMTEHGYFSAYLTLRYGINNFTFQNGTSKSTLSIKREKPSLDKEAKKEFEAVFPNGNVMLYSGEFAQFQMRAPENSEVFAVIDGKKLLLENKADGMYSSFYQLPNVFSETDACLEMYFEASVNGREYKSEVFSITVMHESALYYTLEDCYVYDSADGGSMMDNIQYSKGTKVYVNGSAGDMYRLTTGKWLYKDSVTKKDTYFADIDKEKYKEIVFDFDFPVTYHYEVSDSGKLLIDFYHKGGDYPQIDSGGAGTVRYVRTPTRTRTIITKRGGTVSGFYVTQNEENAVSVYLLDKKSGGLSGKRIVLDAGHGGEDVGALGPPGEDGATEADLNLSLCLMLCDKLEKAGATVFLTRNKDDTLLLKDRAERVRSFTPDLLLSVHHNSVSRESDYSKASGSLVLYSRETSAKLAKSLSVSVTKGTGIVSEGTRKQSLNVCREYRFPSVLVEVGYVCNPFEYEKIITDNFKSSVCDNITQTLIDYFS